MQLDACFQFLKTAGQSLRVREVRGFDFPTLFATLGDKPVANRWAAKDGALYVTQYCFQAGNLASGPDFGRTLIGKASKSALWSAVGRPEGRFWVFRLESGRNPARKPDFRPGLTIA